MSHVNLVLSFFLVKCQCFLSSFLDKFDILVIASKVNKGDDKIRSIITLEITNRNPSSIFLCFLSLQVSMSFRFTAVLLKKFYHFVENTYRMP